jgi:hypothetical protein
VTERGEEFRSRQPQIPSDDVEMLDDGYWEVYDGPLAGLCLFAGRVCYYWCIEWPLDPPLTRLYAVHALDKGQLDEALYFNAHPGEPRAVAEACDERMKRFEETCLVLGWFAQ